MTALLGSINELVLALYMLTNVFLLVDKLQKLVLMYNQVLS